MTFLPVASDGLQSLLLLLPGSGWQQLSNCCFIFSMHPPLTLPVPALLPSIQGEPKGWFITWISCLTVVFFSSLNDC